jgi:hypothetical protein
MSCGSQEYIGRVPLARSFFGLLALKEIKFRGLVNRGVGFYPAAHQGVYPRW